MSNGDPDLSCHVHMGERSDLCSLGQLRYRDIVPRSRRYLCHVPAMHYFPSPLVAPRRSALCHKREEVGGGGER
jgi:hypothetical protein